MLRPFRDHQVVGVKGAYRTRQRGPIAQFVQLEYESRYELAKRRETIDLVDTYAAAYRRSAFQKAGGFDTIFATAAGEDTDFSFRLAERGARLVFQPDAIVYHLHPDTLRSYCQRKFVNAKSRVLIYRRFPRKALRDSHTPQDLKAQMLFFSLLSLAIAVVALGLASWYLILAPLGLLVLSEIPFLVHALRRNLTVSLLAPVLLLFRAAALTSGFSLGVVMLLHRLLCSAPGDRRATRSRKKRP
jgi:cellulose synthase/poly-beta-1,6-N-acetylglucosamine synthase-like glycosyltransferase